MKRQDGEKFKYLHLFKNILYCASWVNTPNQAHQLRLAAVDFSDFKQILNPYLNSDSLIITSSDLF